ncbi:hypothetical protein [Photobacterium leiognathi]|uniref:hypothetical protein n=1 Tax=Photobacterium leiognathi TaxID=553611 RepID=UPI0029815BE0|nr:hypothetical protein [Photobacterium leiognathi]
MKTERSTMNVNDENKPTYIVDVKHDETGITFSVIEERLTQSDINVQQGLCGTITIKDGIPALSVGLRHNESMLDVSTNGADYISYRNDNDRETVFETKQHQDVFKARTIIATEAIMGKPPLPKNVNFNWYHSKKDHQVIGSFKGATHNEPCIAIVTFSDNNISLIDKISIERNKNTNRMLSEYITGPELLKIISTNETINEKINSNQQCVPWTNETIADTVLEIMDIPLDNASDSLKLSLLYYFNKYNETTKTFTCGHKTYHQTFKISYLLTLSDRQLLSMLDLSDDNYRNISTIRFTLVERMLNGNTHTVSAKCTHKDSSGNCAGHNNNELNL